MYPRIRKRNDIYNDVAKRTKYNDYPVSYKLPDKYESSIFLAGEREIHFNAHVDGETITRIKKLIASIVDDNKKYLVKYDEDGKIPEGQEDPFTITYIVNSPGGSVHDILDFVDYLGLLRNTFANIKFTSIITGLVASAGTIMCVVADNRHMTRYAYAMIHELSTGMPRTNYTRIQTHAEVTQKLHKSLINIYQEFQGIDINSSEETEKLETLLLRETWMTADEYLSHGFVHKIICNKKN